MNLFLAFLAVANAASTFKVNDRNKCFRIMCPLYKHSSGSQELIFIFGLLPFLTKIIFRGDLKMVLKNSLLKTFCVPLLLIIILQKKIRIIPNCHPMWKISVIGRTAWVQTANAQIQKISILTVKRTVIISLLGSKICLQMKNLMLDKNVLWLSFVIPNTQKDADSWLMLFHLVLLFSVLFWNYKIKIISFPNKMFLISIFL